MTMVMMQNLSLIHIYFHVSPGKEAEGDFRQFREGQVRFKAEYDEECVRCLCRNADASDFPMGIMGEDVYKRQHYALCMLCLDYKTPVLCEKAMFLNSAQAEEV